MSIDVSEFGYIPVKPEDTFRFQCERCGDCCRNVKGAIMLESLDFFRLIRYLKMDASEFILEYTNMAFFSWGYPILMLRTTEPADSCVFLKDSNCGVQPSKPRTCRTYPLGTGPDDETENVFQYYIVSKKQHHFTGQSIRVSDWMDENFTPEDCVFVASDYIVTGELAGLLRRIDKSLEKLVLGHMLFYKYLNFDASKDFYGQYVRNMANLQSVLSMLAK